MIGLAVYSFHYDQSKSLNPLNHCRILQYLIAFKDLHNFYASVADCEKIFRAEYLNTKLPLEPFNLNNPHMTTKLTPRFMTPWARLDARKTIDGWADKNYPNTRAENIKILDDYLTLCGQNRIRPIMFLPPTTDGYKKHFNKRIRDEFHYLVGQACKKHPYAIFIDGWKLQGLTDRDFYDYGHMNIQGAAKFSTFLNSVIEQLDGH